jgi:hypothetical protein
MIRLLPLAQSLLCMAVLMSAGVVAARAGGASLPVLAGSAAEVAITSATATSVEEPVTQTLYSSLRAVLTNWSSPAGFRGDNDHQGNQQEGDGDDRNGKDHDGDHDHDNPPTPSPEPSTVLSFGVALLIGGGVLLLGRMRETRK